jgi:ribosome-associated protein
MKRAAEGGVEPPSKSELKRRSQEIERLGGQLVDLPAAQLEDAPLPEKLRDAVEAARRITSHGARLRQRQYVGKLMRGIDVEPIRLYLAQLTAADQRRIRREHEVEDWRARLIAGEESAWTELALRIGAADLAELRALARQAHAELGSTRAGAASRQLFRRLREALDDGQA